MRDTAGVSKPHAAAHDDASGVGRDGGVVSLPTVVAEPTLPVTDSIPTVMRKQMITSFQKQLLAMAGGELTDKDAKKAAAMWVAGLAKPTKRSGETIYT